MNRIRRFFIGFASCILVAGGSSFAQTIGGSQPSSLRNIEDSLKKEVGFLCSSEMKGRGAGSEGERLAARHVYDFMLNIGAIMLSPESGDDFGIANPVTGDTLHSCNIAGIIPGYDPQLKGEFILLGTQLDGPGFASA